MEFALPKLSELPGLPGSMNQMILMGVLFLMIILVSAAPGSIISSSDNIIVRGLIVLGVLGAFWVHPTTGILAFIIAARVFLARNAQKMDQLRLHTATTAESEQKEKVGGDGTLSVAEGAGVNPSESEMDSSADGSFIPHQETGDDIFHAMDGAESMNHKEALTTVPTSADQAKNLFNEKPMNGMDTNSFSS